MPVLTSVDQYPGRNPQTLKHLEDFASSIDNSMKWTIAIC